MCHPVSRDAGAPYAAKLLALPGFLIDRRAALTEPDIVAGFALTGFFLERDALDPHGLKLPDARSRLLDLLSRGSRAA